MKRFFALGMVVVLSACASLLRSLHGKKARTRVNRH
jgi:hypothetical protein